MITIIITAAHLSTSIGFERESLVSEGKADECRYEYLEITQSITNNSFKNKRDS